MPRKGENVRKRQDGRWEARYVKVNPETGTRKITSVYADSYLGVKQKRKLALENQENTIVLHAEKERQFDKVINDFLKQAEYTVKRSTYNHYYSMAKAHISPYFGTYLCELMTPLDIEEFAIEKLKNGRADGKGALAPKSVKDLLSVLRMILKYGVDRDLLPFNILNFSAPKIYQEPVQIFEKEEIDILKKKSIENDEIYTIGVYISLYTGLRLGEVCALQWQDVDLERQTVTVSKTMIRLKDLETGATEVCVEKPKTLSSNRVIPIPDVLVNVLRKYKPEDELAYVVTGKRKHIEPRVYYEKYKRFLTECGLELHSFHCLRHTFATNCVRQGFDPKTLSEILGHSDVKITFDRYIHPSLEMKRKYMNLLK